MRAPRSVPLLAILALLPCVRAAETGGGLPPTPSRAWVQALFDSWRAPVPPRHLGGNLYYVGASGVSAWLITTPAGHILLDTGFEDTVPIIVRGVEQLGFKVTDIRLILSSHAHIDHTGGHALMKRTTGAEVVASAADARVLESGGADDFLVWPKDTLLYAPVPVDRIIADGDTVTLGGTTLTAHLTPGHTRGATTWTMELADGGRSYQVVFFSSASINAGTRLLGNAAYPGIVADLEQTLATLKALPCDLYLAPHGGQFAMADKFARLDRGEGVAALVDPAGWRELIAGAERSFRDQLAREQALAQP
ncbi:Metallo-beta-lactamase L1 precursor [Lacunisphaera limnophila]|uniref:Metallo-beta-lactamase L1 n=1 Tax=Lacunisphaera limnophila TaxID=1838286 RepID=A0A1D8AUF8_9BACT|nr:subclass B3 metallo-beta-lactamase [Lacunisphaera limnophila]AOS44532.1 Metallo-beta-lactamase L1 precursor [Lacunisphaera limnophila]